MCENTEDSTCNISYFFYLNVYSLILADKKNKKEFENVSFKFNRSARRTKNIDKKFLKILFVSLH